MRTLNEEEVQTVGGRRLSVRKWADRIDNLIPMEMSA